LRAHVSDCSVAPLLTDQTIRFYFVSGSANDPGGAGNSPDLTCDTGTDGSCSVGYTAAGAGTDYVCALTSGNPSLCDDEGFGDPEMDDREDTLRHGTTES